MTMVCAWFSLYCIIKTVYSVAEIAIFHKNPQSYSQLLAEYLTDLVAFNHQQNKQLSQKLFLSVKKYFDTATETVN